MLGPVRPPRPVRGRPPGPFADGPAAHANRAGHGPVHEAINSYSAKEGINSKGSIFDIEYLIRFIYVYILIISNIYTYIYIYK